MTVAFPPRFPWEEGFPDVVILAPVPAVKQHPDYEAAKSGIGWPRCAS